MKGRLKARGGATGGDAAPQERDAISGQRFGSTAPTPGLNMSSVVGARRMRGRTTIGSCDAGAGSKRSAGFAGRVTAGGGLEGPPLRDEWLQFWKSRALVAHYRRARRECDLRRRALGRALGRAAGVVDVSRGRGARY